MSIKNSGFRVLRANSVINDKLAWIGIASVAKSRSTNEPLGGSRLDVAQHFSFNNLDLTQSFARVKVTTPPGAGQTYQFTLKVVGGSGWTPIVLTLTGAETTADASFVTSTFDALFYWEFQASEVFVGARPFTLSIFAVAPLNSNISIPGPAFSFPDQSLVGLPGGAAGWVGNADTSWASNVEESIMAVAGSFNHSFRISRKASWNLGGIDYYYTSKAGVFNHFQEASNQFGVETPKVPVTFQPGDRFKTRLETNYTDPTGTNTRVSKVSNLDLEAGLCPIWANALLINYSTNPPTKYGGTNYLYVDHTFYIPSASEASVATEAVANVSITRLYISCLAPGFGESLTVTLRKNGVDTALSATISDEESFAQNTTDAVPVQAGDVINWKYVYSSGANVGQFLSIGSAYSWSQKIQTIEGYSDIQQREHVMTIEGFSDIDSGITTNAMTIEGFSVIQKANVATIQGFSDISGFPIKQIRGYSHIARELDHGEGWDGPWVVGDKA